MFLLGTHAVNHLGELEVPLFLSARRLRMRKGPLNRALAPWAGDSAGYSELTIFGSWQTPAPQYAREVIRWSSEAGQMLWAAVQDYMCEPWVLKKTGLSIKEHQRRTVASMLELSALAPKVPWAPVLQGFDPDDYFRHIEMYERAGVNLWRAPVVGVGSVCRRQHTDEIAGLFTRLAATGLPLHGFGVKVRGLLRVAPLLVSADSLAWSFDARHADPLPGHTHKNCANCAEYALRWRSKLLQKVEEQHGSDLGALRRALA